MTAADDFLRSVRVGGETLSALYDQWTPQAVVPLADDITCLTFSDPLTGRNAVWYLDESHNYCGSHIEVVQRMRPDDILGAVAPWFDELARNALSATPTLLRDAPAMPLFLATQLAAAWSVRVLMDLRQIQTSLAGQEQILAQIGQSSLSAKQIRRILGSRVGPETLVVLSPLTDIPLRAQISFVVDHQLIYRFHDPEADCVFYLAWWEKQLDKPPSFYCPKAAILVSDEAMAGMLPSLILGWYLSNPEHVASIAEALAFEARDYGLGTASSLQFDPATEAALPPPPSTASADMISESWAFLAQNPTRPASPAETRQEAEKKQTGRLFDKLRSYVKKK